MSSNKFAKPSEKKINEVINKGGSEPKKDSSNKLATNISIRVPQDIYQELEEHLKGKRIRPSRSKWILEAIDEKMQKEKSE